MLTVKVVFRIAVSICLDIGAVLLQEYDHNNNQKRTTP